MDHLMAAMRCFTLILMLHALSDGFAPGHGLLNPRQATPSNLCAGFDGLDVAITEALQEKFQVTEPNSIQSEALKTAFSGRDLVVVSQTGSGKTMTFLLPMLQMLKNNPDAQTLILGPSEMLVDQYRYVASQLAPDISGITFSTPERLLEKNVPLLNFSMIAIDEVDAILFGGCDDSSLTSMGEQLIAGFPPHAQFIATTAYLSDAHETALLHRELPRAVCVREKVTTGKMGILVPTLRQRYKYFSGNKSEKLATLLRDAEHDEWLSQGSSIVFCESVETVNLIHDRIKNDADIMTNVLVLHDNLDHASRNSVLTKLRTIEEDTFILLSTDIAARGMDLPNIRHVVLYNVPTDVESFVHQVGRTARRGQQGLLTCLVLTGSSDFARYTHLHALKGASRLFSPSG